MLFQKQIFGWDGGSEQQQTSSKPHKRLLVFAIKARMIHQNMKRFHSSLGPWCDQVQLEAS